MSAQHRAPEPARGPESLHYAMTCMGVGAILVALVFASMIFLPGVAP